jgi:hypothetical protein
MAANENGEASELLGDSASETCRAASFPGDCSSSVGFVSGAEGPASARSFATGSEAAFETEPPSGKDAASVDGSGFTDPTLGSSRSLLANGDGPRSKSNGSTSSDFGDRVSGMKPVRVTTRLGPTSLEFGATSDFGGVPKGAGERSALPPTAGAPPAAGSTSPRSSESWASMLRDVGRSPAGFGVFAKGSGLTGRDIAANEGSVRPCAASAFGKEGAGDDPRPAGINEVVRNEGISEGTAKVGSGFGASEPRDCEPGNELDEAEAPGFAGEDSPRPSCGAGDGDKLGKYDPRIGEAGSVLRFKAVDAGEADCGGGPGRDPGGSSAMILRIDARISSMLGSPFASSLVITHLLEIPAAHYTRPRCQEPHPEPTLN